MFSSRPLIAQEIRQAGVDQVVVGGDVVPGPMPRETLRRLLDLDLPVQFIYGNCERAVLAQMSATEPGSTTYWGTVSGRPPCGHTHMQFDRMIGRTRVVNAGSVPSARACLDREKKTGYIAPLMSSVGRMTTFTP